MADQTPNERPTIAITMGDPAGIGPEIALAAIADETVRQACKPVLIGSIPLLERVALVVDQPLPTRIDEPELGTFNHAAVIPGTITPANGAASVACIDHAITGTLATRYDALVTAPIAKAALRAADINFPGHTELLSHRCGGVPVAMMLHDEALTVSLVTCHRALASVPKVITQKRIATVTRLTADALTDSLGRPAKLAVLGLNPHAGEGGLFGNEERAIIWPAIDDLRRAGYDVTGPLPPDTAFTKMNRKRYDGFVCMYHDQGLIPFKALAFDTGVNVTLGLPIIRTSVDHGTAFDIAWQGKAKHASMVSAILLAARMAQPRLESLQVN